MANLVRLRISLADQPGSLARVAAIIGENGGNITSIDVHRAGVVAAVDDILVEFPENYDLSTLRDALLGSGVGTLLSHQAAHALDPVVGAFRRASEMIDSRPTDPDEELARSAAELCASPVAWVKPASEATQYDAGRFALERGGAIALRTPTLPDEWAERLPGEVWLLAVPDPELIAGGRVVFVARGLASEFTSTEIARIEALITLHKQVERLLARA
jgi:ACT domain